MKRNLAIAITLCFAQQAYSQTNTFPSTGSVGIGTTSPQESLHVSGGNVGVLQSGTYPDIWSKWIRIGATNSAGPLYLGTNKNGISSVWDSDGAFFGLSDEGSNRKDAIIAWGDDADDNLRFLFNGGELARFTPGGFWGIGTSSPSTRLHISDGTPSSVQGLNALTKFTIDAAGGGFAEFRNSSNNNTYTGLIFTDDNLGGYVAFRNVPDDKLHVGGYGGILFEVGSENGVGSKTERMRIDVNGNIGIGTTIPGSKLDVTGVTATRGIRIPGRYAFGQSESGIEMEVPSNEYNAIRAYNGAQHLGTIHFFDDTWGGGSSSSGTINLDAPSGITLGAWNNPSAYFRKSDGYTGIGTTTPDAKLTVNGTIHSTEVKVTTTVPGPDYVFEKDYPLPSLEQIKSYIDQNKHLPEVPSAKEMEANGVNLGEMNMLLLKKVEELTLHLIEQSDKIEAQHKQNEELRKEIRELKTLIKK